MKGSLLLQAVLTFLLQEMRWGTRGVMLRLLHRTALVIVACLLGLAVILGGTGEAARDPLSPACEKYAYKPPSDTRTLARLKQECARFLAAGIRKGVAANDQWDVQALRDWARGLQVCTEADDPLACATKLDTVAAATPVEPPRPTPAPRPKSQAPPAVPPIPKDEIPKPSPTPDAGGGGAIFAAILVVGLLVILLSALLAKSGRTNHAAVSSPDEASDAVVARTNSPDHCPRCGSPYFHQERDHGDLWICDMPGCGSKFEAGREGTATREPVQGDDSTGQRTSAEEPSAAIEKATEETRDDLARLKVEQIRLLVNEAVRAGYIFEFEQERTMLSTAEGYNRAGVAVLGAMILNLGQPTFNTYCENQRRAVGWLQSRTNPIQAQARDLRAKRRGNDPSVRSMLEDVEREFVAPLVGEHVKNGGQAPSAEEVEATCAMLLAKILWDSKLGNPDLSAALRMLGGSRGAGASDPISGKGGGDSITDSADRFGSGKVRSKIFLEKREPLILTDAVDEMTTDEAEVFGTVVEVAAALFKGISDSWGSIMPKLATEAGILMDDTSPKGVWFRIECLIFEWFLRDFVIAHYVESRADAIRDHLMYLVYEALREAVRVEGMPEEVLREFDRRRMERFNEYYEAFVAQRHERKRWWGLERLGFLAAERIVGSRDPIACVVLSSEAAGVYKSLGRVARQIKVVGQ